MNFNVFAFVAAIFLFFVQIISAEFDPVAYLQKVENGEPVTTEELMAVVRLPFTLFTFHFILFFQSFILFLYSA